MKVLILSALVALAASLPTPDNTNRWDPNCGVSKYADAGAEPAERSMIVGGWDARKGEWPWQVSMGSSPTSHYCGAVIVNANWIVSAAHCCAGEVPSGVFLTVGHQDFSNPDTDVVSHTVTDIFMHEDYDDNTLENDICMMKLTDPITFTENVQPACPPTAGNDYVGVMSSLSGWGSTGSGPSPDILQTTNLPIPTNADCETAMLAEEPTWFVTPDQICAGTLPNDDRDTCQGDSGGPLVTQNGDSTWSVIGLTSWGFGCADGVPGVYCRVSYFLTWIDGILAANP